MARGTFANIRLRNQMAYEKEGGFTTFQPDGEMMTIFDASQEYAKNSVPLVVIAGKEYGTGSSRDWAAKGPMLLGVKVVIAESFERIHRSNLAGIGILPLQFSPGETAETLGIIGDELLTIEPEQGKFSPGCLVRVSVVNSDGSTFNFITKSRLDTSLEVNYFQYGGLLNEVINAVV
jgi:aconitate hydratase